MIAHRPSRSEAQGRVGPLQAVSAPSRRLTGPCPAVPAWRAVPPLLGWGRMDRKLIRPSLSARPSGSGGAARRALVPESTHAEAGYLVQAIESGAPLTI